MSVRPAPSRPDAVAIASAVASVLEEEAVALQAEPTPMSYRSPWRAAALREGVVRMPDSGWPNGRRG